MSQGTRSIGKKKTYLRSAILQKNELDKLFLKEYFMDARSRPIFAIDSLLYHLRIMGGPHSFDSNLLSTLNLCPIDLKSSFAQHRYEPFGFYQKEVTYVLAIENKASSKENHNTSTFLTRVWISHY